MKPIEYYLQGEYAELVSRDDGPDGPIFTASLMALPGCMAQGSTDAEALKRLKDLRPEFLRALHGAGLPIPDPDNPRALVGSLISFTVIGHAGTRGVLPPVVLRRAAV